MRHEQYKRLRHGADESKNYFGFLSGRKRLSDCNWLSESPTKKSRDFAYLKTIMQRRIAASRVIQRACRQALRRKHAARFLQARSLTLCRIQPATLLTSIMRRFLAKKKLSSERAERNVKSTILVQCYWRKYCALRVAAVRKSSAFLVTRTVSNYLQHKLFNQQIRATIDIQRRLRGHLTRTHLLERQGAASEIQKLWFRHKKHIIHHQSEIAATKISKNVRTMLQRGLYLFHLRSNLKNFAALAIQRIWRGFSGRLKIRRLNDSASIIQKVLRNYIERKNSSDSAVVLQRTFRRHVLRTTWIIRRLSAVKIQAFVRGLILRENVFRFSAALRIQRTWRKNRHNMLFNAVTRVQALFRGHMVRKITNMLKVLKCLYSASKIQYTWRRWRYSVQTSAATAIQSAQRRHKARSHFLLLKCASVVLQRFWRHLVILQIKNLHQEKLRHFVEQSKSVAVQCLSCVLSNHLPDAAFVSDSVTKVAKELSMAQARLIHLETKKRNAPWVLNEKSIYPGDISDMHKMANTQKCSSRIALCCNTLSEFRGNFDGASPTLVCDVSEPLSLKPLFSKNALQDDDGRVKLIKSTSVVPSNMLIEYHATQSPKELVDHTTNGTCRSKGVFSNPASESSPKKIVNFELDVSLALKKEQSQQFLMEREGQKQRNLEVPGSEVNTNQHTKLKRLEVEGSSQNHGYRKIGNTSTFDVAKLKLPASTIAKKHVTRIVKVESTTRNDDWMAQWD